eukprot:2933601-Heterocapsa_arctica.AAC.1
MTTQREGGKAGARTGQKKVERRTAATAVVLKITVITPRWNDRVYKHYMNSARIKLPVISDVCASCGPNR